MKKFIIIQFMFLVYSIQIYAVIPLETSPYWRSQEASYYSTGAIFSDVNRDGFIEFLFSNGNDMSKSPQIVHYNSQGVLETTGSWRSGDTNFSGHSAAGDINYDGYPDWAVSNYIESNGTWAATSSQLYRNIGGIFEITPSWKTADKFHSFACAFGDADGDGDLDLAVACGEAYNGFAESNRIYKNQSGSLQTTPFWTSGNKGYFYDVAWVDIDNDGDLDVAFLASGGPVIIYYNKGGAIETTPSWQSTATDDGNTLAFGDLNNDGYQDLAVANNYQLGGDGYFEVYMNRGGTLEKNPSWKSSTNGYGSAVSFCDVEFDGDLDVAAGRWWGNTMVYENVNGKLTDVPVWECSASYESVVEELVWGDVDNDGVRFVKGEKKSGDGIKKVFYLTHVPAHVITKVMVDGRQLGLQEFCYDLVCGWISFADAPQFKVEIDYSYSIKPDLGVSNWDRENYVFKNVNNTLPDISVTVSPKNAPVIIPQQGGILTCSATVVNNLEENSGFDVWSMVRLPNGQMYGPLFNKHVQLSPLQSLTQTVIRHQVPANAPSGVYYYFVRTGTYPSVIISSANFSFIKD